MENINNSGDERSARALASKRSSSPKPTSATEVPQVSRKRRYSYAYKMEILAEADTCKKGELGVLLRREGLYHSTIIKWKAWRNSMNEQGAPSQKSSDKKLQQENKRLEKENMKLTLKLKRTEGLLDIQKKALELMEEWEQDEKNAGNS